MTGQLDNSIHERLSKLDMLRAAIPVLNRYCNDLKESKEINCSSFTTDFSDALRLESDQDMNEAILYFDKELKSHPVLFYVMQNRSAEPREEEKPLLAKAYGLKSYDSPERSTKQAAYWTKFLSSHIQKR